MPQGSIRAPPRGRHGENIKKSSSLKPQDWAADNTTN